MSNRKFDVIVNGISQSVGESLLTFQEDGRVYKHYNADMSLDTTTIDAENLTKLIQDGEALVTAYIQAEVDKFNEANGTKFSDAHAMGSYKDSTVYPHATTCKAIWDWNEAVWMASRAKQAQAVAESWSAEKFISELPSFK